VAAGLIISELERSAAGSNIKNVADGLWWAVSTITTVGYGDRFPVTAAGKGVAVVLMLVGVGLFGLLAGTLASFFVERGQQEEGSSELQEIGERLARIEQALGLGLEPGPKEGLE
jgi:voltage-gated potassium channel